MFVGNSVLCLNCHRLRNVHDHDLWIRPRSNVHDHDLWIGPRSNVHDHDLWIEPRSNVDMQMKRSYATFHLLAVLMFVLSSFAINSQSTSAWPWSWPWPLEWASVNVDMPIERPHSTFCVDITVFAPTFTVYEIFTYEQPNVIDWNLWPWKWRPRTLTMSLQIGLRTHLRRLL